MYCKHKQKLWHLTQNKRHLTQKTFNNYKDICTLLNCNYCALKITVMEDELINQTSNKDALLSRLQAMYPDMDEETMYGKFMEFMDDMDRASKAHAELGKKLTQHPRAALMLADVMDGKHPKVAMKRYYADNDEESDEELEAQILEAERERLAEEQEMEGMKAEYEQNLANSATDIEEFKTSKNLTDETFAEFLEAFIGLTGDLLSGKLNRELLEIAWKGRNYESDMASEIPLAEERGRISARNEKIEVEKKRMEGDGLPIVGSSTPKIKETTIPIRRSVWENK